MREIKNFRIKGTSLKGTLILQRQKSHLSKDESLSLKTEIKELRNEISPSRRKMELMERQKRKSNIIIANVKEPQAITALGRK